MDGKNKIPDTSPADEMKRNVTFMWPCIVTDFLKIKPPDAPISQIYSGMKLYMFRAVPLPINRSLFTVHSALVYVIPI
jgi:hypothetical protein